jgi:hypothetical protein
LQASEIQIALDVGSDLPAGRDRALQRGVAAGSQRQDVAGRDVRVALRDACAVFVAAPGTGAGGEAERGAAGADAGADAGRHAQAAALAVLLLGVVRGQQIDPVVGLEREAAASCEVLTETLLGRMRGRCKCHPACKRKQPSARPPVDGRCGSQGM